MIKEGFSKEMRCNLQLPKLAMLIFYGRGITLKKKWGEECRDRGLPYTQYWV